MANPTFDAVMRRVGGKEWNYDSLSVPQCGLVEADGIEEPICDHNYIFDVHTGVPEFGGTSHIGEQIQRGIHCSEKPECAVGSRSSEDDALRLGIEFINAHSPEGDALNEQTFWILSSIREGSGTPIDGWPEAKVRFMCQNKSRGLGGAGPRFHFPLHTYSLKGLLAEFLLPLVYPLLVLNGVMKIGWPGVWKDSSAVCHDPRHWRRVPQVYEVVFLDDPSRDKLDMSDLKSYMTAEEDQTCSGRYNDGKLVCGQVRAYAGKNLSDDDEPSPDGRTTISPDEFLQLLRHSFPGEKAADVMAVLKRSIVFILGKHAPYLIHLDLLSPHDKSPTPSTSRGT
ncbi:unnamed protein product [Symbiodinium natans]|uniref:Uncharacterized protein n=1 Tax=Symbiodinium natans TaxID=878477 RepID=A0A812KLC9_9DINO|nr:unnamed protein product [Symbiodinium natans]